MKPIILLFPVFFSLEVIAQSVDSTSKITFRYDKGYYSFGTPGKYAVSEIIEYSKNSRQEFVLTNFLQIEKSYNSITNTITSDTIRKKPKVDPINKPEFSKLFQELNTSRNNFNGFFTLPHLKRLSKNDIITAAKKYGLYWCFESENSDRNERRTAFRDLRSFFQMDSFLWTKKTDPRYEMAYVDVWNALIITCTGQRDTINFRSQFFNLFGQPINRYINRDFNTESKVVNLEANIILVRLLPKNSLVRNAISLNSLKEPYIKWYLENYM